MIKPHQTVERRELSDLFVASFTPDDELGKSVIRCLWVIGATSKSPVSFEQMQSALGVSTRTLRRYFARLRSAGFTLRYRPGFGYVYTGFDPNHAEETRRIA